ncbi:MAG TPA: universal stress protein [Chitinophagaceae bacterium]|nr:universal stress protein [Chitinophagaceae bacterium]
MEKIVIAVNAVNPSRNALEMGCFLARLTRSRVKVLFLENEVVEEHMVLKQEQGMHYVDWEVDKTSTQYQARARLIEENLRQVRGAACNREVSLDLRRAPGVPAREVAGESRYADLVVVDPETSFHKSAELPPTEFVREVLAHAECPVLLSCGDMEGIDEIVFTYEDSASSVFAIRQFAYLFPQLRDRPVTVLHINEGGRELAAEREQLAEWLSNHFTSNRFREITGKADEELINFLLGRNKVLVVLGAYGRGVLSNLVRQSHANQLIRSLLQPLFIAHT